MKKETKATLLDITTDSMYLACTDITVLECTECGKASYQMFAIGGIGKPIAHDDILRITRTGTGYNVRANRSAIDIDQLILANGITRVTTGYLVDIRFESIEFFPNGDVRISAEQELTATRHPCKVVDINHDVATILCEDVVLAYRLHELFPVEHTEDIIECD